MLFLVHANANVTKYEAGLYFYEKIGFQMVADLGVIKNNFYKVLIGCWEAVV